MDYAALRREGIQLLERLAGDEWTDFNAHDPGITLLEQLCYVLSDLAYRAGHPIPDLLAEGGAAPDRSLHPPSEILSTDPVTLDDIRRLVLDHEGVRNAWVEPVEGDSPALFFVPSRNELQLQSSDFAAQPVHLRGLYRVLIDPSGDVDAPRLRARIAECLFAHRGLGHDFAEVTVLQTQPVRVDVTLEVSPVDDPQSLVSEVRRRLADSLSPAVPFSSRQEQRDAGRPVDQIDEGPALTHGVLPAETLARAQRRKSLYSSDLMHTLMNIPAVRAVSRIRMSKGGTWEEWSLPVDADKIPKLDAAGSKLTLRRAGQVILRSSLLGPDSVTISTAPTQRSRDAQSTPPAARSRSVGKYTSLQTHLPPLYGIGTAGLPQSASLYQRAKANQLRAYLLIFDQLCANSFAQLAHIGDLFAHGGGSQTYFTQAVEDADLGLSSVRPLTDAHRARLQQMTEPVDSDPAWGRRHRFLNHLLARFAEPIADQPLSVPLSDRARVKQELLQTYPLLSRTRGTGEDLLQLEQPQPAGLVRRLQLDLGFNKQQGEELVLLEHIHLRPIREDLALDDQGLPRMQDRPLLSALQFPDPYSLQVSFILPQDSGRFRNEAFRQFIEDQLRQRLPAQLVPYVHWLDATAWTQFQAAYQDWRRALRSNLARGHNILIANLDAHPEGSRALVLRGARDRLIDLLQIAETQPLADTEFTAQSLTVGYNMAPSFFLDPAQKGVRYELFDEHGAIVPSISVDGTGERMSVVGPSIQLDHTYRVRATKIDHPQRSTFLFQRIAIKIGLNTDLPMWMPSVPASAPLVDYGRQVEVRVAQTQAGARYSLLDAADRVVSVSSAMGNGGEITLTTVPMHEDTVLRVHAMRDTDLPDGIPVLTAIMDTQLPLAVRANPSLAVSVVDTAIHDHSSDVTILIHGSQRSVHYTAYACWLHDSEFPRQPPSDADVLTVSVPNASPVYVLSPPCPATWQSPANVVQQVQADGTDGDLLLTFPNVQTDSVVVVQASKSHAAGSHFSSTLQVTQPTVILVRPSAVPTLQATLTSAADGASGSLSVSGGEPGVFYFFRLQESSAVLGLPAYFHKRDDHDASALRNRGLGQAWLETDLVVARDASTTTSTTDVGQQPPGDPCVDIQPLPTGGQVFVMAQKARTGIPWRSGRMLSLTAP